MIGHPSQGSAHKEALMELARENLMLKHQLKGASLELTRLRGLCDKYQVQHEAQKNADKLRTSQSRYWTEDEHQRFMDAIQKFGHKDMKGIACFVGSRNATQVRSHVQKYYMRLARSNKQTSNGLKSESNHGGSAPEIDAADDYLPPLSTLGGASKIASGGSGSRRGQDGSTSETQQQQQPAMPLQGPQSKARTAPTPSRQEPHDGPHQPLAAHQQCLLQAEEAACKKKHEEATSGLLSNVKSQVTVALNATSGQESTDEDRGDQSPSACSTGSDGSSSTTTQGKGHGSSESNASNKSNSVRAGSTASGASNVVFNTGNGSSDSACGSTANSRAGSDNGVFDVADDQELFDCA